MTQISRSALVPYTPAEMFRLVDEIEHYAEFLPWCQSSTVLHREPDTVKASITIAKGAVKASFTTLNRLQVNKMIEMRLLEGPFRKLQGFWRFTPLQEQACRVSLDLEFDLANPVLRMTLGPVFHQITNTLVDAFIQRARSTYGNR